MHKIDIEIVKSNGISVKYNLIRTLKQISRRNTFLGVLLYGCKLYIGYYSIYYYI